MRSEIGKILNYIARKNVYARNKRMYEEYNVESAAIFANNIPS